jgi:hypothetical protein
MIKAPVGFLSGAQGWESGNGLLTRQNAGVARVLASIGE